VKLSEDTVIEWVRARLARFKVPRHVLFVDESEIPLTASGRAKKFELTKIAQQKIGGAT
jgi:fatty-acyl-CoA synthase